MDAYGLGQYNAYHTGKSMKHTSWISLRPLLARISLQQSLPWQRVAPATSSGSSTGNPAEASRCSSGSHVFKKAHRFAPNLLQVSMNFRSFSPYSQPQEPSRTKTHLMHLPPREADLHPLSHQPHRAQDADQAEEKVAATASPPSLCHEGPSTRCFSIRPTGVVRTPEGSAAALCARAGGCKLGTGWSKLDRTCSCQKICSKRPVTQVNDRSSCRKQA